MPTFLPSTYSYTGGRVLRSIRHVPLHLTHPKLIPEHVFRGRGGGEGAVGEDQVRGNGEGGGHEGGDFEAGQDQGGQDQHEADELPEAGRAQAEDGADDGFRPGQGERAGYSLYIGRPLIYI